MIKLSILIPSVHTRRNSFLPKIQDEIYKQIDNLSEFEKTQVEVIVLSDNKTIMLGDKRNLMVEMAQGEYIQFVDDDDRISSDFIKTLLDATKNNCDVISFLADVSINGDNPKICDYSIKHKRDYNTRDRYYRIPNHISCVKREVSLLSSFPSLKYAEDQAYAKLLLPHLKTEHKIDRVLYYYDYSDDVTETQYQNMPDNIRKRRQQKPIVDIVFLSKASSNSLKKMTQNAINTAISGANQLPVNVIVVEQEPNIQYDNAKTIYHNAPFHFNAFNNLGASQGESEWIMFANSDTVFHNGWLHNLLIEDNEVLSPKCPNDVRQKEITSPTKGNTCGKHFSGWCFMMTRKSWEKIGRLPEVVSYWFSDNATIKELNKIGITPMIVPNSLVTHLGSVTGNTVPSEEIQEMTWGQAKIYNDYYKDNLFHDNINYKKYLKNNKNNFAVAISNRGRKDVLKNTLEQWEKHYPNLEIIVVHDDSDSPRGIAKTKNICIDRLLETDCEHLFIADDDIYPITSNGLEMYAKSPYKHMSFSFEKDYTGNRYSSDVFIKSVVNGHNIFNSPNGCLLYCHRSVLESGIRYDENYGVWGKEHMDFSVQVRKSGLTPYYFIDVKDSDKHFYSHDQKGTVESSVPEDVRVSLIKKNTDYFNKKYNKL